jgi:hypothetical protein
MKTLIRNEDQISIYLFEDSVELVVSENGIIVGNPVEFTIGDRNSTNTTLVEGIDSPDDWSHWKYKYIDGQWVEA